MAVSNIEQPRDSGAQPRDTASRAWVLAAWADASRVLGVITRFRVSVRLRYLRREVRRKRASTGASSTPTRMSMSGFTSQPGTAVLVRDGCRHVSRAEHGFPKRLGFPHRTQRPWRQIRRPILAQNCQTTVASTGIQTTR